MTATPEPLSSTHRATDAYTAAQQAQDAAAGHGARTFRLWRGADGNGEFRDYTTDAIDVVHLAFANFRSTLVQEPVVEQIIPVAPRASEESTQAKGGAPAAVEFEPDEEDILADLLPRNIAVQIYHALLENQAGFYGSQMTAMDNATRNAGDMINRLSIQYNRQRQAAITTELVEIISGAEAL